MSSLWNIVVVSPHRDDAAFSLGLSIQHWLSAGHSVSVLNCFTRSEYAPYSDAEALHPNDRTSFVSALRRKEDIAWQKLLPSRFSFHDLDLLDAPLRLACAVDEVLTVEIRPGDRALARVAGAIAKSLGKRDNTAILAPLAVGGHIDHRITTRATLQVTGETPAVLAFYEDLPYAARPEAADTLPDIAAAVLPSAAPCFAATPWLEIAAAERVKTRMAECYDSQIDSEVVQQIAGFSQRYAGRERMWANPAFLESGLAVREGNDA